MGTIITMPRYGANMEEGMVAEWNVAEGDEVAEGDVLCVIEIEKLTNDMESPAGGVVRKILCPEGEARKCGEAIAVIAGADEDITALLEGGAEAIPKAADGVGAVEEVSAAGSGKEERTTGEKGRAPAGEIRITPKAKKLAEEKGVDYRGVRGTGIHGAITRQDIKEALADGGVADTGKKTGAAGSAVSGGAGVGASVSKAAESGTADSEAALGKMSGHRRATAKKMMESMHSAAQMTIFMDADVTELVDAYGRQKRFYEEEGLKLSYTAVVLKATARALRARPKIRTMIVGEDAVLTRERINLGLAIDAEQGLIVPVLRDVDRKDLKIICREVSQLVDRAKAESLSPDDFTGGVMTVTNVGMLGVKYFTPILNTPESAILGVGTLTEEPKVIDGGLHVRNILHLSFTYDHRIIDGAPAARYLGEIVGFLEAGSKIFT